MLNSKVLKTDNFILRELNHSDIDDIFAICNQIEIKYIIPGFFVTSVQDVNHIFTLGNFDKSILLGIENNDKKIIGLIYAYINNTFDFAKITYLLDETQRGNNIMSKALKLFIEYLYTNKIVNYIQFDVRVSNKASIRIMNKLKIPYNSDEDCLIFQLSLTEKLPF